MIATQKQVRDRMRAVYKEEFPEVPPFKMADLVTKDLDSLDVIEYVMALEEEFDIDIHDEDVPLLTTFWKVSGYIGNRLGERG